MVLTIIFEINGNFFIILLIQLIDLMIFYIQDKMHVSEVVRARVRQIGIGHAICSGLLRIVTFRDTAVNIVKIGTETI